MKDLTHSRRIGSVAHRVAALPCCLGVILLGSGIKSASAQSEATSLRQQLAGQLALGTSRGCGTFLGVGNDDSTVIEALQRMREVDIGNELAAICSPSSTNSASSLGGGLSSVQATKTVSQFRPVRRRVDQRLRAREGSSGRSPLVMMFQPTHVIPDSNAWSDAQVGLGLFSEFEHEQRGQAVTGYEQGYEAKIKEGSIGFDYGWATGVVGMWLGYEEGDGTLQESSDAELTGAIEPAVFRYPEHSTLACGGVQPGGNFDTSGKTIGVFAGWRLASRGFLDLAVSRTMRDVDYTRTMCVIESSGGTLYYDFESGRLMEGSPPFLSEVDSIFAGKIFGSSRSIDDSASIRTGLDIAKNNWLFGPRASLTYTRSRVDSYRETGSSTVAGRVRFSDIYFDRMLGGPVGFELAYQERTNRSLILDVGGQIQREFGADSVRFAIHASAYWRRQFHDDRVYATVHFAQDYREIPAMFSFATNEIDANNAMFSAGLTAAIGQKSAVRFEVSHLASDDLIDSTVYSVQFRAGL